MQFGNLTVKMLDSGFVYVRGIGPCNWAQGPKTERIEPFIEASDAFRHELFLLERSPEFMNWLNAETHNV